MNKYIYIICLTFFTSFFLNARINQIWLSHRTSDISKIVINWYSPKLGNSVVYYQIEGQRWQKIVIEENVNVHHVEIPLTCRGVNYFYQVMTGEDKSEVFSFKSYPFKEDELRIAIVGNWGYANTPNLRGLIQHNPHLLLSLGDNIECLHHLCGEGEKRCIFPYLDLINSNLQLFRSIPFMPILGNHDKEMRKRGTKYPVKPVYDLESIAFRSFFELPDEEWKWFLDILDFDLRIVALDLNHTSDVGTTWQSCHDFDENSIQYKWYEKLLESNKSKYLITLTNEMNSTMRSICNGRWRNLFEQGDIVFSGYGYFQERATYNDILYYTTSLKSGDVYLDEYMNCVFKEEGFILLTLFGGKMKIELFKLNGEILDTQIL